MMYWDDEEHPSVEFPTAISSAAAGVNMHL